MEERDEKLVRLKIIAKHRQQSAASVDELIDGRLDVVSLLDENREERTKELCEVILPRRTQA